MRIKFFVETNWPRDKKRVPDLDGIEWMQDVEFPMLPRVGDMVSLNEEDDFREVEQVFVQPRDGDPYLAVHFKFEDTACWVSNMTKMGWVET